MTSALLDRAKEIATAKQLEEDSRREAVVRADQHRQAILREMHVLVVEELRKIDGAESPHGKFRVEWPDGRSPGVFAYLWAGHRRVAWFRDKVVSFQARYSDDAPLETYIEPRVWARFYPPTAGCGNDHDGTWDVNEERHYHNGGWTLACGSVAEIPKFFTEMSDQLAKWL